MKYFSSAPERSTSSWIQAMVWLIVALIMGVLTFMLWMASTAPVLQPDVVTEDEKTKSQVSMDFGRITHVDELNELRKEVKPISFDALVRDLRQYPSEFKDKSYFKQHEKDWTVQVMDVAEHKIITDYLDSREDRKKFAYLRYRDENDQPRYILTYEALSTPQLAMGTAKMVDFNLPDNIRVLPEEMSRYLSIIENYELSQPAEKVNLNPSRRVKLKPTTQEISPPEDTTVKEQSEDVTTQDNTEESLAEDQSIAESVDVDDTLAVNVERKLNIDDKEEEEVDSNPLTDTQANSSAPATTNTSNDTQKDTSSDSPVTVESSQPTRQASAPKKPSNTTSTAGNNSAPVPARNSNPLSLPPPKPVEATPPSRSNNSTNRNTAINGSANLLPNTPVSSRPLMDTFDETNVAGVQ